MNKKISILLILLSTIWVSCQKDLNITDFEDDFGNYESELKIEGLLQQDDPMSSIVRIIKSSPVTDTDIFNGKDDDNDGEIDEYDEILPLIQDTSATVKIRNLANDETWDFDYVAVADSFSWEVDDDEDGDVTLVDGETTVVTYGGYKPIDNSFHLEANTEYKLEVYSKDFDQNIYGTTTVYPAVEFIDTLFSFQDSIVTMNIEDEMEIFWKSAKEVTAYYITYDEIADLNNPDTDSEMLHSYEATIDQDLTENYVNASVGKEVIWGVYSSTILRITVEAMSPEYGKYMFSSLPLNDPNRTNLTDEDGEPVMGCFGASAAKSIYVLIEE